MFKAMAQSGQPNTQTTSAQKTDRNVEIKARVNNNERLLELTSQLSGGQPKLLEQHDVFFHSPHGRLKMRRVVEDGNPRTELIWYDRPDVAGPKLSDFKKLDIPEAMAEDMKELLSLTAGVRGEVAKQRHLFLVGQTRVHVDKVKDLGHFMELEVCLREEQTLEEGKKIADELREALEIPESDLLTGAYMDMLQKK